MGLIHDAGRLKQLQQQKQSNQYSHDDGYYGENRAGFDDDYRAGGEYQYSDFPNCTAPQSLPDNDCVLVDSTTQGVMCHFSNLVLDNTKIQMKGLGGEPLDTVMLQDEEEEFVQEYQMGSISLKDASFPSGASNLLLQTDTGVSLHYLEKILSSMKNSLSHNAGADIDATNCEATPTLFLTRYEYVHLFHTFTDVYNAYEAYQLLAAATPNLRAVNVVFLDGHPRGHLDDMWSLIFGGQVTHVKHLKDVTCYQSAVFVPAGYTCPLFGSDVCAAMPVLAKPFLDHVLKVTNTMDIPRIDNKVIILEQVPTVTHPRSDGISTETKLAAGTMTKLQTAIQQAAPAADIEVVKYDKTLTVAQQIKLVRSASVLIGAYGPEQTLLFFMNNDNNLAGTTLSIELHNEAHSMYAEFAKWKEASHLHKRIFVNEILEEKDIATIVDLVKIKLSCNRNLKEPLAYSEEVLCED